MVSLHHQLILKSKQFKLGDIILSNLRSADKDKNVDCVLQTLERTFAGEQAGVTEKMSLDIESNLYVNFSVSYENEPALPRFSDSSKMNITESLNYHLK